MFGTHKVMLRIKQHLYKGLCDVCEAKGTFHATFLANLTLCTHIRNRASCRIDIDCRTEISDETGLSSKARLNTDEVRQWQPKVHPTLREAMPFVISKTAQHALSFSRMDLYVRLVIETDGDLLGDLAASLRPRNYGNLVDLVFEPTRNEYAKMEANELQRGLKDVSFCKLELLLGSQPGAFNPLRLWVSTKRKR